jgi:sigma-B regulation protein RsbU (phosphoserine phosphatase)
MIRAFIVDDEEPARERLRRLLDGTSLEIVGEAGDGSEALPQIGALAPDIVFLDIQMPGLSGLDVAARLQPPRPRIVFCTAYDQFAIDAFEHHAVDYLLKPVNRDRLARTIDRVSGEIDEQRRLAREQLEAERTQVRLMPSPGSPVETLDCAGSCRPARGIGGDYYDFLRLDRDRIGLTLGDVSGKGTFAGLLVAALQGRMQALVARGIHNPAHLLGELNDLTVGTMEDNRFATVAFAACNWSQGTLTYASAGHPQTIVVRDDGSVRELGATGPAIGWSANAAYNELSVEIRSGDVIVLSSDGVSETVSRTGDYFGTDGIAQVVRSQLGRSASEIVGSIMSALEQFSDGQPAEDDRTLVVARVL